MNMKLSEGLDDTQNGMKREEGEGPERREGCPRYLYRINAQTCHPIRSLSDGRFQPKPDWCSRSDGTTEHTDAIPLPDGPSTEANDQHLDSQMLDKQGTVLPKGAWPVATTLELRLTRTGPRSLKTPPNKQLAT